MYINKCSYIDKVLKYALMIFHIFIASGAFELTISVLDFDLLPLLENNYSYTAKENMLVVLDNVLIGLMFLIIDKINNHFYDVLNMHGKFGFHIVTLWFMLSN